MNSPKERVVVVGASSKPDRYSNKAIRMLQEYGHEVVPINPKQDEIEGLKVVHTLDQVSGSIDTVTLYVGPAVSSALADALIKLHPRRVIFNPGAENPLLAQKLSQAGIDCEQACTLVLLRTGQF